jgi:hypothetical protein
MKGKYLSMTRKAESGPYPQVDLVIQRGREVARSHLLPTLIVAFAALAGLGAVVADPSVTVLAAQPVSGVYELSFFADTLDGLVPLTNNSLPILTELVLKAHVEDGSGHPAKRGSVIFQDCSLKGQPAASAACVSGSGTWLHIITLPVDQFGNASVDFGFVSNPRTIGFRFEYIGQGSGIANGASAPGDVTWTQ